MRRNKLARPVQRIRSGEIVEYPSVTDAALSNNVSQPTMTKYVKMFPKIFKGFQWKFKDQDTSGTVWVDHPSLPIKCSKDGRIQFLNGRITKGTMVATYISPGDVRMSVEINHTGYMVHRLVAETFIPNTENKPTVDHIDRDATNNHVSNLRWATHSEQNYNRGPYKHGLRRIKKKK
jgi:hypothetical protein